MKPLVFAPRLSLPDLYRHTVIWLVLALLLEALEGARAGRLFTLFVPALLGARILVVGLRLSPAEVLGGGIALLVWPWLARLRRRSLWLAVLFTGVVILLALEPFRFSTFPRPFGWVPFRSFLRGSAEVNILSFFEKAFTYGGLVWLWVQAGWPRAQTTGLSAGLVLGLRLCQVYIPGRSAEITDPILLTMLAFVLWASGDTDSRGTGALGRRFN